MIIDSLENMSIYDNIPQNVINFVKTLTPETEIGRYEIDKNSYANIDVYETKNLKDCKFEAHKNYIDIQMLLSGIEELDYTPVKDLIVSEKYDEKRDIMFFENPDRIADSVILEAGKFALIYPHEAHRPQVAFNANLKTVKKVVVKIHI